MRGGTEGAGLEGTVSSGTENKVETGVPTAGGGGGRAMASDVSLKEEMVSHEAEADEGPAEIRDLQRPTGGGGYHHSTNDWDTWGHRWHRFLGFLLIIFSDHILGQILGLRLKKKTSP